MAEVEKIIGLSALNHYNDKINSVIDEKVGTGGLTIDNELSDTSTNPVQNKAVKAELDKKANKNEIPTELPANGGNADTVNGHTVNANVPANAKFTDTVYVLPTAGSTLGGVKTTSTVSSTSGLTACPIISGVPYYKDTNTTYDLSGYAQKTDIPISLPANGGDSDTVGGHTVMTDVPENAVFTDTVPDLSGYARLTDIPSSLPANGGNADTLNGKHASEFAMSLTNLQFGSNRIELPDGVNVGEWLVENAKNGNLYFIASKGSRTNLPNVSADWMWFSYDGNRYFARAWIGSTDTKDFILNCVNSVGEWKEIYTSDNKPYVTGTASYKYSTEIQTFNVLNFTPSFVIIKHGQRYSNNGTLIYGAPVTNGFQAVITDQTTTTLTYIAFK